MATRANKLTKPAGLKFQPATAARWPDVEKLFGERGACNGCWCMWWRFLRSEWRAKRGAGNRAAFKRIVEANEVPGLLAYADGEPIGWCAFASRDAYPSLDKSRVLARVDDKPVWSVSCFFVAPKFRRMGVSTALIRATLEHIANCGGGIVEGYPNEPENPDGADLYSWTGLASSFRAVGFTEVARRSPTRPIMRKVVRPKKR